MFYPTLSRRGSFAPMYPLFRNVERNAWPSSGRPAFPAVNVWQGDDAVAVTAELPGVKSEDIDITVHENTLTISGGRKAPDVPEGARWHRNERGFGSFSRTIRLPFDAEDDKVEARMSNGVLRIVVGRPEKDKPRKISIKAA